MSSFTTRCPACKAINKVPRERVSETATCGKCKSPLFDGAAIEGTEENLDALLSGSVPVVVDFWAPWCSPCVGFAPVFKEVAKERSGSVRFLKVDTQAQQRLAAQYQIRSIPTLMLFKNAKRVEMINGALAKTQFNSWLDNALHK